MKAPVMTYVSARRVFIPHTRAKVAKPRPCVVERHAQSLAQPTRDTQVHAHREGLAVLSAAALMLKPQRRRAHFRPVDIEDVHALRLRIEHAHAVAAHVPFVAVRR